MAAMQDDGGDEVDVCFAAKKHTTRLCGECTENCCPDCIDPLYCGAKMLMKHNSRLICCAILIGRSGVVFCALQGLFWG